MVSKSATIAETFQYRYLSNTLRRSPFSNNSGSKCSSVGHGLNIGSIVRTANAFNVSAVHIVGKRDWNRRGAMVTDKYLTVLHHPTVEEFKKWCDENNLPIIGIDNLPVSKQLESYDLPAKCVMLFGQEGFAKNWHQSSINGS